MSEKIKITIVFENEELNNGVDGLEGQSVIVTHDSSVTIMSTLLKNDLLNGSFCGGRGDCGRCRIQFLQGATYPTPLERKVMSPAELRQGYRLACLAKPKDDCMIKLALLDAPKIAIVSDVIEVTESVDCMGQENSRTKKHKPDVTESDEPGMVNVSEIEQMENNETGVMIAVDLGTTTIAMQLMEMNTGRVIDTYCEMNPQRRYGADVLSRITASCEGNREILQKLVVEVLERGVARFRKQAGSVKCMCIAGNTTMEHLLMGYDVSSLGSSPFTPVEIGLQEYRHPEWNFTVWLTPGISTFVGGDIVAGLYAMGMLTGQLQGQSAELSGHVRQKVCFSQAEPSLLIDLGTNGEMAITDGVHMTVTATAAGPAFEGGAGAGIVGSDMIACVAELLKQGILDETGLLAEPFFTEGVSVRAAGGKATPIHITQHDIRSLQMAKAAVRAGVEVLLERMKNFRQHGHVYLAGGFGYYLDVEAAFRIGLLPEYMRGRVKAVGNTSLMGAFRIGRDLWQHEVDRQTLEQSLSSVESINLAKQSAFEQLYIKYMNFEEYQ